MSYLIDTNIVVENLSELPIDNFKATIKCPKCSQSYFKELYSTSTAVYYPPIYKDGVNINPDRNTITTSCECMNCHSIFSYNNRGEIILIEGSNSNKQDSETVYLNKN